MPSLSVLGYFQYPIQSTSAGTKRIMSTPLQLILTATPANGNRSSAKPAKLSREPVPLAAGHDKRYNDYDKCNQAHA